MSCNTSTIQAQAFNTLAHQKWKNRCPPQLVYLSSLPSKRSKMWEYRAEAKYRCSEARDT
ncbi:hypothetical protein H5410_006541 [Solanum commersonii]|uniref:Uncharacterized protein n=1 Tax=Solanum commersonii TaxID=4109 RepID=A0A9J6AAK0_SOLCO|nr:hypothetical protein H5410_006541 [Solanum commersonii]